MDGKTGTIFYDFIDPISYLLLLEVERAGSRLACAVEWVGFELRFLGPGEFGPAIAVDRVERARAAVPSRLPSAGSRPMDA